MRRYHSSINKDLNEYKHSLGFLQGFEIFKTNYPFADENPVKRKKSLEKWYADFKDESGNTTTIGKFDTAEQAYKFREKYPKVWIRHYNPTNKERDEELATNRHLKRLNY